jgi:membrane fusion protein, multidrug efflux system
VREGKGAGSKILLWTAGLALIVLPVVIATAYHVLQAAQADARAADLPIPVQAVPARVQSVDEVIGGSSIVQSSEPVDLSAKVVAKVLQVAVQDGDTVHPGDVLVEFDPQLYQANYESAHVSYEHEHNELLRAEALGHEQYASPADLENARMAVAQARVALVNAKIDLANTQVVSPVYGVVLNRSVNPGETSHIDEPLIQLGVLDPVLMQVAVSEDKLGFIHSGMDAEVETDAYPEERFKGEVVRLDPSVDIMTRTLDVYVELPNRDLRLKKGVTGYTSLSYQRRALVIPNTAIVNATSDRAAVYVIDSSSRTHLREVSPGLTANGMTEILAGLNEGEEVVAAGQAGVRDNDKVRVNRGAPWNDK